MGKLVLTGVTLVAGAYDLTSDTNKVELSFDADAKDVTSFASGGWKEVIGGLTSSGATAEGQWEAGAGGYVDDGSWADSSALTVAPWSIAPAAATVGSLAYLVKVLRSKWSPMAGGVGDVAGWSAAVSSSLSPARGQVAVAKSATIIASGSGTALNLGAVPAGQFLHCAVHVIAATGTTPSFTATLQTDDNSGFTSPATAYTFTAATTPGAQYCRISGPLTDTYQRLVWTVSGTSPSFLVFATIGIGE